MDHTETYRLRPEVKAQMERLAKIIGSKAETFRRALNALDRELAQAKKSGSGRTKDKEIKERTL